MKLAGEKPATPATDGPPMDPQPEPNAGLDNQPTSDDKPFNDEPFDAGVEADEQSDPKKFIEQLTGKLGQSLRKYNEEQGQPDFELEKFAINSLLSATHTSDMDEQDQDDIIKKVKTAGNKDDSQEPEDSNDSGDNGEPSDVNASTADSSVGDIGNDTGAPSPDNGGAPVAEGKTQVELDNPTLYPDGWKEMDGMFMNPKKNNMFQPGSNDILKNNLKESEKSSIFGKNKIKDKLIETFNQDDKMTEPTTEPVVKPSEPTPVKTPKTEPIAPSRKNKPFLPMPSVDPDPKASK